MRLSAVVAVCCLCVISLTAAAANPSIRKSINIPAEGVGPALQALAKDYELQVLYRTEVIENLRTQGAVGEFTPAEALQKLLSGTGLTFKYLDDNTVTVFPMATGAGQSSDEQKKSEHLDEIVVTATKRAELLQNVPVSITTETGAELEHRGATELQDIIANTPGLNNPGSGSGNTTNLTIRGVTTGTDLGFKQSTVALLYDDIPVDPVGQGAGASNLRVVDIERVEVLRGPQGTLFGSGSLAGALRYITNKPDLSQWSGSAVVSSAGTETGAGSYYGTMVVNAPIVQDQLGVRFVAYDYDDGGWIDNLRTGEKDSNPTKTYGARLAIAAKPDERFHANLTLTYQDSIDYDGETSGSLYVKPPGTGFSGQVSDGINDFNVDLKSAIAALTLQYDFDPATLTSATSYHNRQANTSGGETYLVPLTSLIATNGATIVQGLDSNTYDVDSDIYTQELRLNSRGGGNLKWTVGTFYLDAHARGAQQADSDLVIPIIGSDNMVDEIYRFQQQEVAGFGEATYTIADQWDLTGGLRVSRDKVDAEINTGGYIPVFSTLASAYAHTRFDEAGTPWDPRVSLAYRPNLDLMLYVQAARGYRVGGVNLTADVGGRPSPPTYAPDSLWSYEIGAKGRALDDKVSYSTAFYYIDWSNIQIDLQNEFGSYTGNASAARNYGVEFQIDTRPIPWLLLGTAFQLSKDQISKDDPTISRPATGLVGVKDGDLLPAAPEGQASGYAEVDFPVAGYQGYVRANANYLGDEWTDFAHNGTKFGGFTTENLRAGINFGTYEVVTYIDNLSNSQGATGALDAQISAPVILNNQEAFRIRPRTAGVTLRAKF
jgi:iron complex outermembrane recepter protein